MLKNSKKTILVSKEDIKTIILKEIDE